MSFKPPYVDTGAAIGGTISGGTPGSILFVGTGGVLAQDNASLFYDNTNDRLGLLTTAPTHTATLGSTSTGIALYNTADQTTNFERGLLSWSSNILTLSTQQGGTGNGRNLVLSANPIRTFTLSNSATSNGFFQFAGGSTGNSAAGGALFTATFSASSGTNYGLQIAPTISGSGTQGYTALLINPTESSTGSGTKLLIDAQVGGVDRFMVDNTGKTTIQQATLGTTALQVSSTATNDDPTKNTDQNRVATTNATVTTLHTIAIPASTTVGISGYVAARRTGGVSGTAEDGAFYRVEAVYKNVAGTATLIGSNIQVVGESQAGWDVTLSASSGNALIQVTGAASNNITWHWTGDNYPVSS